MQSKHKQNSRRHMVNGTPCIKHQVNTLIFIYLGYFMYASGDEGSPGTSFFLESDMHSSAINTCFHFLYSIQVSTLYIYSFSIMQKIKDTLKS